MMVDGRASRATDGSCAECTISLKSLMQISLACGIIRTVLISWLCLYMVPRRLRAIKRVEEEDPEKAQEMMLQHFGG